MTPAEYERHAKIIDEWVTAILAAVKVGSVVFPWLAEIAPGISLFLHWQAHSIKTGLGDGTVVPDGAGGFVPITNSRFDPRTGKFL